MPAPGAKQNGFLVISSQSHRKGGWPGELGRVLFHLLKRMLRQDVVPGCYPLACDSQKTGCLALRHHHYTKYHAQQQPLSPRAHIRAGERKSGGVSMGRRAAWVVANPAPNVSYTPGNFVE